MAEVKWIKLLTEMFDDEKIKLIEAVPEADMILVIWIKLLTLAGKKNMNGYIFLTENIPYTDEMLATLFNRPINTIRLALETFKNFGMINYNGEGQIKITNWEKHQNIEGLERIKELNKKRATDYRKRLMAVGGNNYLEHYQEVYQRDKGKCVYCGSIKDLCLDHLIPLIKGGDNEADNLALACKPCNAGKSGKLIEDTNYHFINDKTSEQYESVKKRLKITHNITQNHALRLDQIRLEEHKKDVVCVSPVETVETVDNSSKEKEKLLKKEMLDLVSGCFKESFLDGLFKKYPVDRIEKYFEELKYLENIRNPVGWLVTALKNDLDKGG